MTRELESVPPAVVLRAAQSLLGLCRAPREVVTFEDRLDHVQTAILSLASTTPDPRVLPMLVLEMAEIAARLAHAIGDVGGNSAVDLALAGKPLPLVRSRGSS